VLLLVGVVAGPFVLLKRLPARAEFDGISVVKDVLVCAGVVQIGEHEAALVDSGADPHAKSVLAELARRGMKAEDVKAILLTHGHHDHTGGIRQFPNAQVMALAAEADVVEGRSMGGAPFFRFSSPRPTGIHLARTLQDGDTVQSGALTARVFALPGHTPGSAAYAIGPVLFLGDSANQDRRGRLRGAPWIFSASTRQNRRALVNLAERLASDHAIRTLVFSHSAPLTRNGVAPLLEFASKANMES